MPQKPVCGASLCTALGVLNVQGLQAVVDPGQETCRHSREFGWVPQGLPGGPPTNDMVQCWLDFLQASVLVISCSTVLGSWWCPEGLGQGVPLVEHMLEQAWLPV